MSYRKSTLKIRKQGVAINADVRTGKLSPQEIVEVPDIIRRDQETGLLVTNQVYDKATEEPLEEGYGYRYMNEKGDVVPRENITYSYVEDGEERPFSLFEPTLGGGRTVTPVTWVPTATTDQYLIERTYEMWGEDEEDIVQLYDLAELIRDYDESPVIEVVLQKSRYKNWGIITPLFFEDSFALIIRITKEKISPEHQMPALTEEELAEKKAEEDAETPTLDQESPF